MLYVIERIEISSLANSFSKNLKPNQSLLHVLVIIDKAYPVLFWKAVWPYYAGNYAGIMYAGLAVGETLVRPTDMHD